MLKNIQSPKHLKDIKKELLPQLCEEIREKIISTISKTGGHLSSSLGATEIITALHYVYDTPKDKIVFDTSHQTYAHKLLTGRYESFDTIRQYGGISGFTKREESEFDTFGAGHASTALSAALGMAVARDKKNQNNKVVAVISDGCMTGGMSYEALQNAGQIGSDMTVILNDNQMFISNRVGALGAFLTKLLSKNAIQIAENKMEGFLKRFEFWGAGIIRVVKRAKVLLFPGMLFEEMGFTYLGPIDGHDIKKMVDVLERVKKLKGPVVLHVVTKKGKGYPPAEEKPTAYHGLGIFDKETGKTQKKSTVLSYTQVFSDAIVKLASTDSKIVAVTAAMPEGTGLDKFRDKFPNRYFDVGIAEGHAVTFAAGMACEGLKPVVAIYSTFLQRAYDQIIHDVCLQNLPVIFCLDRAGVVGEDGPTHHGTFDLSYLRNIPNLSIIAPSDENELRNALYTAINLGAPCAIRYPRGAGLGKKLDEEFKQVPFGQGQWLKKGKNLNILACGNRVYPALKASELLAEKNINVGVIDARFVKPLDTKIIDEALKTSKNLVTVEDNVLIGGFGAGVGEYLSDKNIKCNLLRLGIKDKFVPQGNQDILYGKLGIDAKGIAKQITAWLKK
ncbi:MAG TPA: 1-deoxy-D-xylulose-5-phosphate synthase [Elusimicrobiales bacterium]|nr:1-deoxy-D-xylulose-5-phosphate synthase [Elusimicrobiales bacterium]